MNPRAGRIPAASAVMLPFVVFVATLSRSVTFVDGGELAAAAITLGIAHPPGYPLYTLLGHIFSLLPVGPPAFRVGLLSAASTAAATGLLASIAARRNAGQLERWGAVAGALLFPFANTPWSQSVIVEVYALHGLACMGFIAACAIVVEDSGRRWLALPALILGFSLAHHLTAVVLLLAFAATLYFVERDRRHARMAAQAVWPRLLGLLPLPLLLYLYLPIRSRMNPPVNWDYPETLHRIWVHVSAAQYRPILGSEGLRLGELRRFLGTQLPGEATLLFPVLALVGFVTLTRERPRLAALTGPVALGFLLYNMAYPIHDLRVYYLPVLLVMALWAAAGAAWLVRRWRAPALVAVGALALFVLARNYTRNDLHDWTVARDFAVDVVHAADPRAVIVSAEPDYFSEPMIYLQEVEKLRADIVVLDTERLASPMLARHLEQWAPDLAEACRAEVTAYCEIALMDEKGQEFDLACGRRLYDAMIHAVVQRSVDLRPTYALLGAYRAPMFEGLEKHPEGLLVRMTRDAGYRPFPLPAFTLPASLGAGPRGYDEIYLLNEYRRLIDGRARYALQYGQAGAADSAKALLRSLPGAR